MSTASELLKQHFASLVDDHVRWRSLIADDIVWELPYAPGLGHPASLIGRAEVINHVSWFIGAVSNFRFFDLSIMPGANADDAVAQVKASATIKPTGRVYEQEYVVFLQARDGKIAHLREYFDPIKAAIALDAPIAEIHVGL